jgi:hypothetical protein
MGVGCNQCTLSPLNLQLLHSTAYGNKLYTTFSLTLGHLPSFSTSLPNLSSIHGLNSFFKPFSADFTASLQYGIMMHSDAILEQT